MKNKFRPLLIVLSVATFLVMLMVYQACAAGPMISNFTAGNKHNLSSHNTNTNVKYKALTGIGTNGRETQVCIFCHTPHSANVVGQAPLWNRNFSTQTFQRYSSSTLQIRNNIPTALYGQPNGSSKLCLSCHDGVSRLGAVYKGAEIPMAGGLDVIADADRASFNPSTTNKMKFGHHPVSFVYTAAIRTLINTVPSPKSQYTLPNPAIAPLDKQSRMQCTTCHNAHQNQSDDTYCYGGACNGTTNIIKMVPFWAYHSGVNTAIQDQTAVCTTCHPMDAEVGFVGPWPLP